MATKCKSSSSSQLIESQFSVVVILFFHFLIDTFILLLLLIENVIKRIILQTHTHTHTKTSYHHHYHHHRRRWMRRNESIFQATKKNPIHHFDEQIDEMHWMPKDKMVIIHSFFFLMIFYRLWKKEYRVGSITFPTFTFSYLLLLLDEWISFNFLPQKIFQ